MHTFLSCSCPYCGEPIELPVDPSAGTVDCVEDCPVCCRPIQVHAEADASGELRLLPARDDDA